MIEVGGLNICDISICIDSENRAHFKGFLVEIAVFFSYIWGEW